MKKLTYVVAINQVYAAAKNTLDQIKAHYDYLVSAIKL